MNKLEQDSIPFEEYFNIFKTGKTYEFILVNFLNPTERIIRTSKIYYVWEVIGTKDYEDEGILKDIQYKQHFPKTMFQKAYSKYKYLNRDFAAYTHGITTERINVLFSFKKESMKKMKILKIQPLNSDYDF